MARVVLEQIAKTYPNGVEAIADFDLAVEDGELLVLVGPSGCGKTTLLRMIAGLEHASHGTIRFGDRAVGDVPPKDRDVAMVFQNSALYPHLDVFENIAFSLRLRKVPKMAIIERVMEAAELLGIKHLLDRRPKELSGGEAQRASLGRAIVRRPACFLLDEPLSSLDAPRRLEMRAEIKRLHQRLGITTIYVTHDQEEALTLGRRIVVLRAGRIQQVGEPLEVYRRPQCGFVAGFIGSPPMNFLRGGLVREGDRLWFDTPQRRIAIPRWAAGSLARQDSSEIVLGIRPEAIAARPFPGQSDNALDATIDFVEPLGDRADLGFRAPPHDGLIARVDARGLPSPGANVRLYVDLDRVSFFSVDPASPNGAGENLCLDAPKAEP